MSAPVVMAQYGTKHGHAAGKITAMQKSPHVRVAGVYEPDPEQRAVLTQKGEPYAGVHWYESAEALLADPTVVAVASEGSNAESLAQTESIVAAGKHVWYDKPAGQNWAQWQRVVAEAQAADLHVQMGYMFRYHNGFAQLAQWAFDGRLGHIYSVRAHMSTNLTAAQRDVIGRDHVGGIFYDLAGHMLDQVVWLLGRPQRVHAFLRHDDDIVPGFVDNSLGVFEFARAMAMVSIAAMEPAPIARRFEVYGTRASAILIEHFEQSGQIRLCAADGSEGTNGVEIIPYAVQTRQSLYDRELAAFVATVEGEQAPDRTPAHELLVQETLLRATGQIADE